MPPRSQTPPSRLTRALVAATRAAYSAAGFAEEWTLHHQGGVIGYQGRERIATSGTTTILDGMAVAWT
ncbi:MAG: hypothetical protein M3432_03990, partial [Chloroflexota bacterium]|nr:hypothetical protein [Chloroflexota bacterium]